MKRSSDEEEDEEDGAGGVGGPPAGRGVTGVVLSDLNAVEGVGQHSRLCAGLQVQAGFL